MRKNDEQKTNKLKERKGQKRIYEWYIDIA